MQDEILELQEMDEHGAGAVSPDMFGQTSTFSIWSDCLITVAAE